MWNNTGLASVTQASSTITGIGTDWIHEREGWWLWLRGEPRPHEIDRIISATELETVSPIEMATSGNVEYAIIPMHGLNQRLVEEVQAAATLFKNARDAWDLVFSSFSGTTYQLWLDQGNTGSVAEFLATLEGDKGDKGDDGDSAYQVWLDAGNTGTVQDFLDDLTAGAVGAAAASAAAAATSETNAAQSASDAAADRLQTGQDRSAVELLTDTLDARLLGPKASDPAVDNDGNPLMDGARYWNTTVGEERIYNSIAGGWDAPSTTATDAAQNALQRANNAAISEGNAATSEANAAAHATAASLASNAEEWVSGATILRGDIYWSPGDGFPYRAMADIPNSTTDPKDEIEANFVPVYPPAIGDMAKAVYDTNDNGAVDLAEQVPWLGVTDRPSVFPPDTHSHGITAITGLQTALADKADQTSLFSGSYDDLSDRPALGTAAAQNVETFATAAQGQKADEALPATSLPANATNTQVDEGTLAQPRLYTPAQLKRAAEAHGGGSNLTEYPVAAGTSAVTVPITGYRGFKIWFDDEASSAASRSFGLQMSSDGTTFPSSHYTYRIDEFQINNSAATISASTFAQHVLLTATQTLDAVTGWIELSNITDFKLRGHVRGKIGSTQRDNHIWGARAIDFAPVALRFIATSGVFSGGRIAVEGIGGEV